MPQYIFTGLSASGQPFGANANQWMQGAYNGQDAATMKAMIGSTYDPVTVYILYGAEISSSGGFTTITDGYAFVGGSFYEMVANTYPDPSGGDTNVIVMQTTYGDGVGTTFADSSVANVLINQKFTFVAGTGATPNYIGNFSACIVLNGFTSNGVTLSTIGLNTWANVGGYYNAGYKLNVNEVSLCGVVSISALAAGNPPILTLPVRARPTKQILTSGWALVGGSRSQVEITVTTGGIVEITSSGSSSCTMFLDGITFRVF